MSGFGQVMGDVGHVLRNIFTYVPPGSPAWMNQQNASIANREEAIREADEQRKAMQGDQDFHEHMMEVGALPVVNGMVKEPQQLTAPAATPPTQQPQQQTSNTPMFDAQGNPNPAATFGRPSARDILAQMAPEAAMPGPVTGNLTVIRKADPSRTVKWKDATGDPVSYELPSLDTQRWRQVMQARADALQQQQQAQEQGRLEAQNRMREQYGKPLPADLAEKYGVDPNQKFLPAETVQLATRYFPVFGQQARAAGYVDAAQLRADASKYGTDLRTQTQQAIADQKNIFNQEVLRHRDAWNNAIVAARNNSQSNLNARAFLNNSARNMQLSEGLLRSINQETQRQMSAESILANDPNGTPVTADGEQFPDPWSGRQVTMNAAQRMRLRNALNQSQDTVAGYQQAQSTLEAGRDAILNRFGGGTATPPAGSTPQLREPIAPTPAATPSAPGGATTSRPRNWADAARAEVGPAGALPGRSGTPPPKATSTRTTQPGQKVATKAQVQAYASQKRITYDEAVKEFQASKYTVQ